MKKLANVTANNMVLGVLLLFNQLMTKYILGQTFYVMWLLTNSYNTQLGLIRLL